ncbi:MAG: RNA methyltransferase [Deltaproteobacteria bacterium]|nr:RNA methyltransferase [Deltaproteobacteria bacterium]
MTVRSKESGVRSSEVITSAKNPKVRDAVKLTDRRQRDLTGLMLIEGIKELALAIKGGVSIKRLFYCDALFKGSEEDLILKAAAAQSAELIPVSAHVFEKMAYREDSFGLIAVAKQPIKTLNEIPLKNPPLIIVVEGVEKPGNLGAILRSADAAGVDCIIVCGKSTDIYNPNVVRASIGTVFIVPVVKTTASESVNWLREKGIKTIATSPHAELEYFDANLGGPCAIVMGSEHEGLSESWLSIADLLVRIPMMGLADSLNLAMSTTIMLYEAVRQRREQGNNKPVALISGSDKIN